VQDDVAQYRCPYDFGERGEDLVAKDEVDDDRHKIPKGKHAERIKRYILSILSLVLSDFHILENH
jgi:hypothetical protein